MGTSTSPSWLQTRRFVWPTAVPSIDTAGRGREVRHCRQLTAGWELDWSSLDTPKDITNERQTKMSDFRHSNDLNLTGVAPETTGGLRQRPGRRGLLTKAAVAAVGSGALLAALAIPASASGNPNPWDGAQVGLTYPVYQPKTVLAQPLTSFKLLSCGAGQDESIFATFGKAYTPPSNYGKVVGFSVAEGYPFICANPGVAKQVGVWTVGIPKGSVNVKVSVYCDPAQFKSCTTASGVKNGYVLQWAQPYQFGTSPKKQTQMFIDTSLITLTQALHIVAGFRSL